MRVVLATIVGLIVGNAVNMGILGLFLPAVKVEAGVDETAAFLKMMESFTAVDYLIPLAAHVVGILLGLMIARFICKTSNIPIYIHRWTSHGGNSIQYFLDSSAYVVCFGGFDSSNSHYPLFPSN